MEPQSELLGEQRKHLISHQVNRLCHSPDIDARFETLNAASKNGSHVGPGSLPSPRWS
jgi:hypothetical protein